MVLILLILTLVAPPEDWRRYPVLDIRADHQQDSYFDRSAEPPTPLQMHITDERALVRGLLDENTWLWLDREAGENLYRYDTTRGTDDEPQRFSASFDAQTREVSISLSHAETMQLQNYLLAPADAPDPRPDGPRCEGFALSRLEVGEQGAALRVVDPIPIRDYPVGTRNGTLSSEYEPFDVLDGPVCQDDGAWWQIRTESGRVGWIPESDGLRYLVVPVSALGIESSAAG